MPPIFAPRQEKRGDAVPKKAPEPPAPSGASGAPSGAPIFLKTDPAGQPTPATELDPCAVNAAELTNADLLAVFARADAYVRDPEHYRRDEFYKYLTLRRRTGAEREKRARGGECWLADDITSVPGTLYRLEPGPRGGAIVSTEDGSGAVGRPRTLTDVSILTQNQLWGYLDRNHVKPAARDEVLRNPGQPHFVDIATAQLVWALEEQERSERIEQMFSPFAPGLGGAIGTYPGLRRPFGPGATFFDQLAYARLLRSGAGGGLSGDWLANRGWPAIPGERPAFLEALTGSNLASPGATLARRPGSTGIATEGVFLPPPEAIAAFEAQGGTFIPENLPGTLPVARLDEVMSRYPLPVARIAEDAQRNAFARNVAGASPQEVGPIVVRVTKNMTEPNRPVVTDLMPFALRSLRPGGELNLVYREAIIAEEIHARFSDTWTDPATGRAYRFEIVTPITDVAAGSAAPHSPGLGAIGSPEERVFQVVLRKVPAGPVNAGRAAGLWSAGTGAAGNVVGGVTSVGLERAWAAATGRPYGGTWSGDLRNIAITTPPAAGMTYLQLRLEQEAARQVAARGAGALPAYLSPAAVRVGLPAITAPLITMGSMGLSDHSYPWQEYAVQGTRSAVSGLAAAGATVGFFAFVGGSAATGAEIGGVGGTFVEPGGGTVVGGAGGWVIGALVGTVAYFIVDHAIGDTVEEATRSLVGEPDGC